MKQLLQLIRPFREARNIVALCLAFFLCAGGLWAQTTTTEEVALSSGSFLTDHITWTCADGNVAITQLKGSSSTNVNSNYISAPRLYKGHILSFEGLNGYMITNVSITYTGSYMGNSMTAGTEVSENIVTDNTADVARTWSEDNDGTHEISSVSEDGLSVIYIQNVATTNVQLRPTAISVTYIASGTPPATYTVTFDAGDGTFVGNDHFPNTSNTKTAGTYTLPSAERSGYTFDGWMITGDSQLYTDSYTVSDDVDFTAQYTENTTPDDELTLTFNLSSNPGSWPTTSSTTLTNYTYTLNGVDYTFALKNVKCNSGYLMIYYVGAVGLPAIEGYKLTKVVAKNSGGCSTSTKVGISSSASSESYIDGGGIQTWSTTSSSYTYNLTSTEENTMYYLYVTNKNAQVTELALTYEAATTPTVAAPTFDPVSGTEFGNEGLSVTISCTTEGASIYYTLDGSTPDNQSTLYDGAISLTETTTIKAIAYDGDNASNVATSIYTYVDPNAPGTLNNPYTVAQARAAIDANDGTQGVYATGIVSAIPTAYSTQFSNITFNFVDEAGDEDFLQAYRCAGDEAANVAVGDVVVVYGNLTKYGSTYEFGQGCTLVSLTHPSTFVSAPTFSPEAGTYDEPQTVTLTCATPGASIYYTLDGSEPDNESTLYSEAITVSTTTTIKAIAYVGENASTVATATYSFVSLANISDITEVGAAYEVQGTVVATNSRGFIMGDGTGYVYYYKNGAVTQSVGDMVKVSGTTGTYGQIIQFTNTATVSAATSSNYNGSPAATLITEVPDYSQGYHISDYFEFEGVLTKDGNNYLITVGENQIQISYPTTEQGNTLTALNNKTVHVKGYFSGINSSSRFTTMLESVEEVVSTEPVINVANTTLDVDFGENNGTVAVTFENLSDDEIAAAAAYLCDADGVTATYDWIDVDILNGEVNYIIGANDGEARTAYFKVCSGDVCSDIVTVNQAAYVAPPQDYAELPFEFNDGKAAIDTTDGLTQEGLGSDYNTETTKLRFDHSGDWLVLHFNEAPGELSYSIKGNSFSGGTFTVQTSEDGETYDDLKTYTELVGSVLNETFRNIGENVRYIKWVYTNKSSGNVALGNIKLALPSTEPLILVEQDLIEVGYEGGEGNISVTYENMGDEPQVDVKFFAEDGETPASYSWVSAEIDDNNGVFYLVEANEGEARTAYMKVYDVNNATITSNLITITQAAAPQQYELTVSDFENLEIFTFVDNTDELALEGAGSIMVSENATISLSVSANEGYVLSSLMVDGQNVLSQLDETGLYTFAMPAHNVTVTATAIEFVPGEWVLTSLADLTENDVFVIVGTDEDEDATYALPNDGNSSAPVATPIVVVDGTLAGEPAVNLQWNLGGNATDGYTFYPNGDTENWLYCSTTANTGSNNNIKVGHGDNTRNVFVLDEDGYLITNDSNVTRYLSIYFNSGVAQDWRGYVNNINALPISFYKKVTAAVDCEKIVLNEGNGYEWFRDFEAEGAGHTTPYTGVLLDCWTVAHEYASASMNHIGAEVDTLPQLFYNSNFAHSGDYSLRMKYRVLYAMPQLDSTVDMSRLRLSMWVRQTHSYYKLQVGVMSDLEDESTFVPVALVDNGEITTPQYFECRFTNYDGEGRYIVFKNLAGSKKDPYSTNYLDDVKLTYADEETCVKQIAYTEDFEGITSSLGTMGVEPDCWEVITPESELSQSTCPQLYYNPEFANSGDYSLRLRNRCVYAMPVLALPDGKSISDLTMTFYLRQPRTIYHLQVGVVNADNEFVSVKEIANPNAEVTQVTVDFSTYTGEDGVRIAFRNTLGYCPNYYYSINYIDDINVDLTENMRAVADGNGNSSMSADSYLDGIGVYPNPTTGNVYIDAVDVQKVECYNQMGQLVGVYDNANELNISELSNGVYMLRITVPQGVTMRKVVKK